MSTGQTWQTSSTSLEDTLRLGAQIGRKLRGGEVIELVGDLGSGKTTFVKGLAQGMGSHETVRSPTFTISHQYQANGLTLHHFDFYRLPAPGIIKDELKEVLTDPAAVVVIEWAEVAADLLPKQRMTVRFKPLSEDSRQLNFESNVDTNHPN